MNINFNLKKIKNDVFKNNSTEYHVTELSRLKSKIKELELCITELRVANAKQQTTINELIEINKQQKDQIGQLEKRLKIDSSNSSQSSSQDKFPKKPITNNREKSGKESGGQKGHKGGNLAFIANYKNIDETVTHKPYACNQCGTVIDKFNLVDTRQVQDVIIKKKITNHLIYNGVCACGCENKLELDIPHGVSYGDIIKSAVMYLHNQDLIPSDRVTQTSEALFDTPINESTVYNWQKELSAQLDPYELTVKEEILQQKTLHADESGMKVKLVDETGKVKNGNWLHVICNAKYTHYGLHKKRGFIAMKELGIIAKFTGNLMHDCYHSYFKFENVQHGLCNAHILRELRSITQFYELGFAEQLRNLLLEIHKTVEQAKIDNKLCLEAELIKNYEDRLVTILTTADIEAITLTNEKWKKATQAFIKRIRKYQNEYLAFMHDFSMEFTNNQAERDIRMVKVKQKISGGFRTEENARNFLKIRGFISTARKQGQKILPALSRVIANANDHILSNTYNVNTPSPILINTT